jgi:hypothetical protein
MRSFIVGLVAAVVLAVIAAGALNTVQTSSEVAYSTVGVRI